jgi:hypothetical protein
MMTNVINFLLSPLHSFKDVVGIYFVNKLFNS